MGVGQLTIPSSYAGTTCKVEFATKLPPVGSWTLMCWAYHTGGTADLYCDLGGYSDNNEVMTLQSHVNTGTRRLSLGDLASDNDSATSIPDNEWHHYAMTSRDNGSANASRGYLDGMLQVGPIDLAEPTVTANMTFRLFNSRASTTDAASQWIGHACAFKVWDFPLSEREILREMPFWKAQIRAGLFCEVPFFDVDSRSLMTGGYAIEPTVTGTFVAGIDPPGVQRYAPTFGEGPPVECRMVRRMAAHRVGLPGFNTAAAWLLGV